MMTIGMLSNINLEYYKKESIANPLPNNKVTNEERDKIINSFLRVKEYYKELGDTIPVLEGSYEDRLRKGEMPQAELDSLLDWMDENKKGMQWNDGYDEEYIKIFHTSKNFDELKQKWLEFQAKQEAKTQDITKKMQEQTRKELQNDNQTNPTPSTSNTQNTQDTEKTDNKPFKPIQVESKSKTYKDTDRLNALELAKDRQLANMLEILFNFKSNSSLNNTDKNNLLSLFSKMNLNPISFKGLDIKV